MISFVRTSAVVSVLFLNACSGGATADSPDADPSLATKDAGSSSCTTGDKAIITASQAALTTCTTLENSSTAALNALIADLNACIKTQVDAGTCDAADIQKQVTTLATVAPSLKTTSCEAVTTLSKLTASQAATLKTDATTDFTTTCTYATDLVAIETQLAALFTSASDAGVGDAGLSDGGASGTYYTQIAAIVVLAQEAYGLQQKLPALNTTVQTDIDSAKKTCGS